MKKTKLFLAFLFAGLSAMSQISSGRIQTEISARAADFELTNSDIQFVILSQYRDKATGVQHVYFRQTINGVELFDGNSDMHFDKSGQLFLFHNKFQSNTRDKVNVYNPTLKPMEALQGFAATLGKPVSIGLAKAAAPLVNNTLTFHDNSISNEDVNIKLYYLTVGSEIRLVWNVELYDPETSDWWNARIDAVTGELMEKNNWTVHCKFTPSDKGMESQDFLSPVFATADEPVQFGKGDQGTYEIIPMPLESPSFGNREVVSGKPTDNASPFGWHDTDGVAGADWTITRGNNVYASDDTSNKNLPGYSPDGGASLAFEFPYNVRNPSRDNLGASITNLFYWNNLNHDIFYNYGFDEVSGNFQANNYGKDGLEHDAVFADAQDGSGTNNANFSTPVDGKPGRMQMYLWTRKNAGKSNLKINNSIYAGLYDAPPALFGPKILNDISGDLILTLDGSTGYTACNTVTNDLTGKIAVLYRGTCNNYPQKIKNAQAAGAIAVIVIQSNSFSPTAMSGSGAGVAIPSVMIAKAYGDNLKNKLLLGDTINVTILGDSNANVMYDSDLDNGVITHEYGHGISTRLAGGPNNSSCLSNAEQGGEGWSDFFALCLTAKASDSALDGRGMGTWVYDQPINGLGIRDYKYTKNMAVNPLTYNSIKTLNEVHYIGMVWCTMLYDAYLDMISRYGFNPNFYQSDIGGNNKMLQLVIDGIKLQPCGPGFVDMRDAIIKADSIRNGGANKSLLWKAFARRGLGLSASQGSPTSNTDGTQAFDLPNFTGVLNQKAWENVSVFPNPASNFVQIALPDQATTADIQIIDYTGRMVAEQSDMHAENGVIRFETRSVETGVYIIRVKSGGLSYQTKLVIE